MAWRSVGVTLSELESGRHVRVEVEGREVLLLSLGGSVRAIEGTCPHEGGDLAEGTFEDGRIVCPLHGASYDLRSGAVLADPHGVEPPAGGTEPLKRFAVRVRDDGGIEVDLVEPARPAG